MSDFGAILIKRLDKAANRNQLSLDNIQGAKEKITVRVIPVLEKDSEGNQIALAAIREVYSLLEREGWGCPLFEGHLIEPFRSSPG